jgi:hypothetical protein
LWPLPRFAGGVEDAEDEDCLDADELGMA